MGLGPRVFLGRPGNPQGEHMDQILTLPTMLPFFYVDYTLERAVQKHRIAKFPRGQCVGEMIRVKGSMALEAELSL